MFFILESTLLKQKGFLSFFKTHTFNCTITNNNVIIEQFQLKSKSAFIGYIFEIPNNIQTLNLCLECKDIKQNYLIDVLEAKHEIKINNEKFKGCINITLTNKSVFVELENKELIRKGCDAIQETSQLAQKSKSTFMTRKTYYDVYYYVDLKTQRMMWDKHSEFITENLPAGWSTGLTKNGQLFYINHYKNYTQWENPFAKKYAVDLESKMLQYRLNVEGINILQFFDFARFKILAKRKYAIQSTAKAILNARKEDLTKQPFLIFEDEIGEDYGAIIREFFYITSLEFMKDERLKSIGVVFDVKTIDERKYDEETKIDFALHNHENTLIDEELRRNQDLNRSTPNIIESLFNIHLNTRQNGNGNDHILSPSLRNRSPILDTTENTFYTEENIGKNNLNDKDFFTYLGIFLAMAFDHEINIVVDFSLAFYENLMTRNFTLNLIQDPQLQSSFVYILTKDMKNEDIYDEFGNRLTEENKAQYVDRMVKNILFESKLTEYDWILEGFHRIVIPGVVNFFSAKDLASMLIGKEELTFEMIKNSVLFLYCSEADKEVQFLWNILEKQDEHFLRQFVQFLTGSASIPMGGLRGNKFKWYLEIVNDKNIYVRASACINKLFIGRYDTEEAFKKYFMFSIQNTEGFHKV